MCCHCEMHGELHLSKSLESQVPVNVKYEVEAMWKEKLCPNFKRYVWICK